VGLGRMTAADAGTWKLGDLVVNRLGMGAVFAWPPGSRPGQHWGDGLFA
jgi:hypothetical protein